MPLMAHILDHPQSRELEVISAIIDESPTICDHILQDLNRGKSEAQRAGACYVKELEFYGFKISMSRKGNPYDNAYAESLIKTIKSEEVHLWEYRTIEDVKRRIPYFIDEVYNQKRLHSSLGYRPPCEYEALFLNQDPESNSSYI